MAYIESNFGAVLDKYNEICSHLPTKMGGQEAAAYLGAALMVAVKIQATIVGADEEWIETAVRRLGNELADFTRATLGPSRN